MKTTKEQRLTQIKEAAAAGRVVLGNDAAKEGGRAVKVKAGYRLGTIVFQWSRPGIGFGELVLRVSKDGALEVDREEMGVEFCVDVIRQALQEAQDL